MSQQNPILHRVMIIEGRSMNSKPLLDVLGRRTPKRRPIWFMRQAGRYLPEYRSVREKAGSFLDLCYNSDLAAEVTMQPLRRFDLDAAIVFADILVVPHAMGLRLNFAEGEGPQVETVRDAVGLKRLGGVKGTMQVEAVCGTLSRVRSRLGTDISLIGFCGAPWTVASYIVEGGSSKRELARLCAYEGFDWFRSLLDVLVLESIEYLSAQVEAGAEVVQIFDSWAGDLPIGLRREFVILPIAAIVDGLRKRHPDVPVIVFARGVGDGHAEIAKETGTEAVGVEAEASLASVAERVGEGCAVQGNLDPVVLLGSEALLRRESWSLASAVKPGRHIFNLGHGIKPETDPSRLQTVIDVVREFDGASGYG